MNGKREESARKIPLLFVASPSAKDPTWEERSPGTEAGGDAEPRLVRAAQFCLKGVCFLCTPGKSTLSLVSFANYKWFEEWKDDKVNNRGAEYKELKQAFIDTCLDVVMDVFPKITQDKVNTPLSVGLDNSGNTKKNKTFILKTVNAVSFLFT